jgi:SdrD B-like domain
MSEEGRAVELQEQTQQLLQGPLKHVRGAALAAALLPLASVAAAPAAAQNALCASGGICGVVWNDVNGNGLQDPGEPGVEGAVVSLDGNVTATDSDGFYYFFTGPGTYTIAVQIPPGTQPSPPDVGSDDTIDSDGVPDGLGNSVAVITFSDFADPDTDFGFSATPVAQPGTGTPGYWKNHPEAWPVASITVGGVVYSQAEALAWLGSVGKDRTSTMFSSLVSAKLNVLAGNDASCVSSTIDAADAWMSLYGPVGSSVHAASFAWRIGEPLHRLMDNYNNGMLCAPHRN